MLGAAFKPGSDDVRDSPALDVAQISTGWEPGNGLRSGRPRQARQSASGTRYATRIADAAQDAHVVLLLTEWVEFAGLGPDDLAPLVARRNIVDGRSVLDPASWHEAGWNYRALGLAPSQSLNKSLP